MRFSKSYIEKRYRSYKRFLFSHFSRTPVVIILFISIVRSVLAPYNSVASKVFHSILGLIACILFALAGGYMVLTGLFLFCEQRNLGTAIYGLLAGFIFGAVLLIYGIEGFLRCLQ